MSLVIDRVRERYPEYDNLSDSDLTLSLGQKFPQYLAADPTFKNEFDQASIGAVEHGLGVAMEAGGQVAKTIPLIQDAASQPTPMEQDMAKVRDIVARRQEQAASAPQVDLSKTDLTATDNPLAAEFTPGIAEGMAQARHDPVFELVSPLTDTEEAQLREQHPRLLGAFQSVRENANQLTTPVNLGLLATGMGVAKLGPIAARGVSLAFAAMMAKQVPDIAARLGEEYAKPEGERDQTLITRLISDGLTSTGFTLLAGFHGLEPPSRTVARMLSEEVASKDFGGIDFGAIRSIAPLTAKALEEVPKTPKVNVELPKETTAVGTEPMAEPGPTTSLVEAKGPITGEEITAATTEAKGVPEAQPIPLADAWEKYDNTGEIGTVSELADHIERLIYEGKAPESLQRAVDKYRDAVEEDFKMAGRGDLENDEAKFTKAIQRAATKESKQSEQITKGVPNASSIQQATEVHGNMQPPPEPSAGQVPSEKGGAGVQPQTEGGIQTPSSEGELTPDLDPKKKVKVIARGPDGEDVAVTMKAKEAVDRITKRKSALQALLDCLGGA